MTDVGTTIGIILKKKRELEPDPEPEHIDPNDLEDAPAGPSVTERVMQAFPGAQEIEP